MGRIETSMGVQRLNEVKLSKKGVEKKRMFHIIALLICFFTYHINAFRLGYRFVFSKSGMFSGGNSHASRTMARLVYEGNTFNLTDVVCGHHGIDVLYERPPIEERRLFEHSLPLSSPLGGIGGGSVFLSDHEVRERENKRRHRYRGQAACTQSTFPHRRGRVTGRSDGDEVDIIDFDHYSCPSSLRDTMPTHGKSVACPIAADGFASDNHDQPLSVVLSTVQRREEWERAVIAAVGSEKEGRAWVDAVGSVMSADVDIVRKYFYVEHPWERVRVATCKIERCTAIPSSLLEEARSDSSRRRAILQQVMNIMKEKKLERVVQHIPSEILLPAASSKPLSHVPLGLLKGTATTVVAVMLVMGLARYAAAARRAVYASKAEEGGEGDSDESQVDGMPARSMSANVRGEGAPHYTTRVESGKERVAGSSAKSGPSSPLCFRPWAVSYLVYPSSHRMYMLNAICGVVWAFDTIDVFIRWTKLYYAGIVHRDSVLGFLPGYNEVYLLPLLLYPLDVYAVWKSTRVNAR
mmetsp:Transcript_49830/g.128208  ORF Transcript_49830/g.128208 Transcript_49830/m.128208 type:complete len:523 (-) Transcript_49830:48-1616(-)